MQGEQRQFNSIVEYEAWSRNLDEATMRIRLAEERRTFRRERRLDLRWAILLYAVALIEGVLTALTDVGGFAVSGVCLAFVATSRLNASFENGEI